MPVSDTDINIAELQGGNSGGGGGKEEIYSPNETIDVTETPNGHNIDINETLKNKLETAYESQIGRYVTNLQNYNKVELFRVYYDRNGATGRNVSFDVFYRNEYDIISFARFNLMCGYASSKGGDYLDFEFVEKYDKDGADIISRIKACRIQRGQGMTDKNLQGCVVIYMDTTQHWDSCSFVMGARYPDDNIQPTGGANYDYMNTKFVVPSSSIGEPVSAIEFDKFGGEKLYHYIHFINGSFADPSEVVDLITDISNNKMKEPLLLIDSNGSYTFAKCKNCNVINGYIEIVFSASTQTANALDLTYYLSAPIANPSAFTLSMQPYSSSKIYFEGCENLGAGSVRNSIQILAERIKDIEDILGING